MGLLEINDVFRKTIINLDFYLKNTTEHHIQKVKQHHEEDLPENKSICKLAAIFQKSHVQEVREEQPPQTDDNIQPPQAPEEEHVTKHPYMHFEKINKKKRWQENKRAGRFYEETTKNYIDQKGSFSWLQNGELKFDEERLLLAAQDQGLMTNGFKKMSGLSDNDRCRFCHTATETSNHLISGCQTLLADGHYTRRHNKVCSYLHWTICNAINIPTQEVWNHKPEPVTASKSTTVFYDKIIETGRYIENKAIKPDIVVWDHSNKSALNYY